MRLNHPSHAIVLIGMLIGTNLVIAKYIAVSGLNPVTSIYWVISGAAAILSVIVYWKGQKLSLRRDHLIYYMAGGILGVTGPQLLSYIVLQKIPASFFTVLVTLSPLATFVLASLFERKLLPFQRLAGILIGFGGILLATRRGLDPGSTPWAWLLMAFSVPLLLGLTNIYRNKAYPAGSPALSLAAGTLISQVLLLTPIHLFLGWRWEVLTQFDGVGLALLASAVVTALTYFLTYELQRHTDGVGFSQVGYFVTLTGVALGIVVFNEPLTASFLVSVLLLFLGLAVSNGHISLKGFRTRKRARECQPPLN